MPELRRDPITGNWVALATERAKRPDRFRKAKSDKEDCPFCYGHEDLTPPEKLSYRPDGGEPDTPGWRVRVVSNKYPVFAPDGLMRTIGSGLYQSAPSIGGHEVIVHSPDHDKSIPELNVDQVALVIRAYRDRYLYFKAQREVDFVEIILNHGKDAGASLEHSHSQVFAMPLVPPAVQDQLAGASDYTMKNGRCIYCETIGSERKTAERVIREKDGFFAYMPYASRLPFESWVLPVEHQPFFEEINDGAMRSLAEMLIWVLGRYNEILGNPSYNMFIHTTPCKFKGTDYHWHIEIIPKLTAIAGFEFGTGMHINVTTPEEAANYMRGEKIAGDRRL